MLTNLKFIGKTSRLEIEVRVDVAVLRIPSSPGNLTLFLRSSADWMRPAYIMEGNLLYVNSTDLNVNYIFKNVPVFDKTTEHHSLAKLTHKINHHRRYSNRVQNVSTACIWTSWG